MKLFGFEACKARSFIIRNYYDYNYKGFNMTPHSHTGAEFMYVDSGECDIFIYPTDNNKEYKKIRLKKRQFIIICSNVRHRLFIDKERNCTVTNLEFEKTASGLDYLTALQNEENLYKSLETIEDYTVCNDNTGVGQTMKKILTELSSSYRIGSALYTEALMLELLIQAGRSYTDTNSDSSYYISKTMDFINRNFSRPISVGDIATDLGLNAIYLERLIKKHTSNTLLWHINTTRLTHAKKLIENTTLPLTDIGFNCGFNSRQGFYENFKKFVGSPPSQYRKAIMTEREKNYKQTPYTVPPPQDS